MRLLGSEQVQMKVTGGEIDSQTIVLGFANEAFCMYFCDTIMRLRKEVLGEEHADHDKQRRRIAIKLNRLGYDPQDSTSPTRSRAVGVSECPPLIRPGSPTGPSRGAVSEYNRAPVSMTSDDEKGSEGEKNISGSEKNIFGAEKNISGTRLPVSSRSPTPTASPSLSIPLSSRVGAAIRTLSPPARPPRIHSGGSSVGSPPTSPREPSTAHTLSEDDSTSPREPLSPRMVPTSPPADAAGCIQVKVHITGTGAYKKRMLHKNQPLLCSMLELNENLNPPVSEADLKYYGLYRPSEVRRLDPKLTPRELEIYPGEVLNFSKPHFIVVRVLATDQTIILEQRLTVSQAINALKNDMRSLSAVHANRIALVHVKDDAPELMLEQKELRESLFAVDDMLELWPKGGLSQRTSSMYMRNTRMQVIEVQPVIQDATDGSEETPAADMDPVTDIFTLLLYGEMIIDKTTVSMLRPCSTGAPVRSPGTLYLTNYRLIFESISQERTSIAIGSIGKLEIGKRGKGSFELFRLDFAHDVFYLSERKDKRFLLALQTHLFPAETRYFAFLTESSSSMGLSHGFSSPSIEGWKVFDMESELLRQGVTKTDWTWTTLNHEYMACDSYPETVVVPVGLSDSTLRKVFDYRARGRIPALTYRHRNGHVIFRASQPKTGMKKSRCKEDEALVAAIVASSSNTDGLMVYDARPRAAALANHAKGAGYEDMSLYPKCKIKFLDIDNIHAVRDSWNRLKELCIMMPLQEKRRSDLKKKQSISVWLSSLAGTGWLEYIRLILKGSVKIVKCLALQNKSVLTHCSDGWDRTAQLCALAQIMLDPYFRTFEGFAVVVEKDWLSFGHKFGQRLGAGDKNFDDSQRSPVFFQFIDCVWQLLRQFPDAFEFNEQYLIEVIELSTSLRFGTFMMNTDKERSEANVAGRSGSIWTYLSANLPLYRNHLYASPETGDRAPAAGADILFPSVAPGSIVLWEGFYMRELDTVKASTRAKCGAIVESTRLQLENEMMKKEILKLRRMQEEKQAQ
eukprot:TRINITY_DN12516_c0_g1_i1.p1 TRINITY_DN12516_c0_g1~~TRINITY_DN12516_c0_g1_i1.p1  ORF type:complete len:1023 (+),score=166.02 TRINITY_DN12516_c0_g1_i1:1-3069(+)